MTRVGWGLWLVALSACTFERREPETEPVDLQSPASSDSVEAPMDLDELALVTVHSFRESVAAGDLAVALARLDAGATIVDPLVGRATETSSRGELLLELRSRHAEGLVYEPLDADVIRDGETSALVVTTLLVSRDPESAGSAEPEIVVESAYLVGTGADWRIRHLQRSVVEP